MEKIVVNEKIGTVPKLTSASSIEDLSEREYETHGPQKQFILFSLY